MEKMDIPNFRDQIELFLDRALSVEDQEMVKNQINQDPTAEQIFKEHQSFRAYIKQNYKKHSATPDLLESIKNNLPL